MHFDVITLFPEMIQNGVRYGVTGRAIHNKIVGLSIWNPRDYTHDKHKTVDDKPYGGGPGMVMKYQPLFDAVSAAKQNQEFENCKVICLSPQGKLINQVLLASCKNYSQIILVAGRYEGIDERFISSVCDEEWSLGDYVISGGELAALVVIDAITRLIPGVLGDDNSAVHDSHSDGFLDYPHFTRPERLDIGQVPAVLLSGNHAQIERWRLKQIMGRTWQRRPDLLKNKILNVQQKKLLEEFKNEID